MQNLKITITGYLIVFILTLADFTAPISTYTVAIKGKIYTVKLKQLWSEAAAIRGIDLSLSNPVRSEAWLYPGIHRIQMILEFSIKTIEDGQHEEGRYYSDY